MFFLLLAALRVCAKGKKSMEYALKMPADIHGYSLPKRPCLLTLDLQGLLLV